MTRLLLDFLPIVLFVIVQKTYDIYVATAVLMAATAAQVGYIYWREKQLSLMHKVTLGLIVVFGTLTLLLHDERFIKYKPTVLYASMSMALAVALWVFKKNILSLLLGKQLSLPNQAWTKLAIAWIFYGTFMATANALVAVWGSTQDWVNFKLWGYVFPVIFLIAQTLYIMPFINKDELR